MLTIYTLSNCDTCRKAVQWLRAQNVPFQERAIRETPPSAGELKAVLVASGGQIRKLFNTSGLDYRALKLGEKLPEMSDAAALKLLGSNGSLVKRPFVVGPEVALVGFDADAWKATLVRK